MDSPSPVSNLTGTKVRISPSCHGSFRPAIMSSSDCMSSGRKWYALIILREISVLNSSSEGQDFGHAGGSIVVVFEMERANDQPVHSPQRDHVNQLHNLFVAEMALQRGKGRVLDLNFS